MIYYRYLGLGRIRLGRIRYPTCYTHFSGELDDAKSHKRLLYGGHG